MIKFWTRHVKKCFKRISLVIVYIFLTVNKSREKTKANNELILLTSTACVAKA